MASNEPFQPTFWLSNPHVQTLWPFFFRTQPKPEYVRQRIELPDGDFIDLDWFSEYNSTNNNLAILVHGLQGDSNSHYIRGIGRSLNQTGHDVVVINLRGRSGQMNRLAIFGHAGFTDDIDFVIRKLKIDKPQSNIKLMAVSLGASMVLNWLAKHSSASELVSCAVAISTPFDLKDSARRINSGFSKVYQHYLISSLKRITADKLKHMPLPNILPNWQHSRTFFEFDDAVTSRLHGFSDVFDYYRQASTRKLLKSINTPLLLIQSRDDPFMSEQGLPLQSELNPNTRLETFPHGGHVGFVSNRGVTPYYWLDHRVINFFSEF